MYGREIFNMMRKKDTKGLDIAQNRAARRGLGANWHACRSRGTKRRYGMEYI